MRHDGAIGVFDSGVGGISVLRHLVRELPNERFVYFGDSAHAPYGEKSLDQVRDLSFDVVERLLQEGIKSLVIACNTATSAAGEALRTRYPDLIIVGSEPALKPAIKAVQTDFKSSAEQFLSSDVSAKKILVLATPMTLGLKKYHELLGRLEHTEMSLKLEISNRACPGLAARIEQGKLEASDLYEMLAKQLDGVDRNTDAVVLGCTHYPFILQQLKSFFSTQTRFFDGGAGTARHLKELLATAGLLAKAQGAPVQEPRFLSSLDDAYELELYRSFYHLPWS